MESKKVIIIGAGIGGLATANLLAKAGHQVTVYEKSSQPGGRAGRKKVAGFTFDTGPSWYLMPEVFEHYYDILGESVGDWLDLQKLTPAYKAFFENAPALTITGDIERDKQSFEAIEPGAGKALERYVAKSDTIYTLSVRHFLYSNFERLRDFFAKDILQNLHLLPRLLLQPIDRYVERYVHDTRLKQILEYPMVFLGASPFTAPAMYSLMSALDFKEGVFYPQGGIYTIIESLAAIGKKLGVQYIYNTPVESIEGNDSAVRGVRVGSTLVAADIVISNADLHFTETQLVESRYQTYPETYWRNKEAGPSALLMYLGIRGRVPEFEHHNLLLVDEWRENFAAIYETKVAPNKASLYISKTSHTDPSVAPVGNENIFVLVPLPAGVDYASAQLGQMADHYLQQIQAMTGVALQERLIAKELFGPNDFKDSFYSWQSSMLGQSHLLKQSAFFRTPNESKKLKNLYYVGGSTTPGIGLPMCLIGAELVYKRIIGDKKAGRIPAVVRKGK